MAKKKHVIIEERTKALEAWGDSEAVDLGVNKIEYNDKKIGIIAGGIAYQYAKEALGDKASYLKIGCLYPLPEKIIRDFAAECEKVYVIEELDPYIEDHCRKLGINVIGKEQFTLLGEYSQSMIKKVILGEENAYLKADINVPARPPVLCAGCTAQRSVLCSQEAQSQCQRRYRLLHARLNGSSRHDGHLHLHRAHPYYTLPRDEQS